MNIFSFFGKLLGGESTAQDANLPLKINFKTTVTFEINPIMSAVTNGAMVDAPLDNLKVLKVQAISSINIDGMEDKKIYRYYFNRGSQEKNMFLQVLCERDNVQNIDEILFCCSRTEPPAGDEDISFFMGDGERGLGETSYNFSRQDLYTFLPSGEVDRRLTATGEEGVEYQRVNPEEAFMPAFTGVETVIADPNGVKGESRRIMNLMPHSRALTENIFEEFIVAFWVTTSKNGSDITIRNQLPLAEYIFAIRLEQSNIKVI